ncbi:MAG: hypothetical protein BIP78_1666 [Candidatus Bipolaricaulis sibiricus]|uniref:VCBS repeat-containing protein n=1 Tax=Bipolaricaulis sibiricus TaxID=2501609 RepID=A0A410FWT9_BIPS1|nr:MAG: hypothetical protein BIP78_1666 [Candidatus Bipolaricaulis sibiricus]
MRDSRRLGIVVAVALAVAVGAGGASPERLVPAFGGALPLWEPEGSPVVLLPGAVMQPPVDTPRAMVVADITGDGRAELIVGGDYLHVLSLRDAEIAKHYLTVFVGVRKPVSRGGGRFGVRALAAGDGDGLPDLVVATHDGELWVLRNHAQWSQPRSPVLDIVPCTSAKLALDPVLAGRCHVINLASLVDPLRIHSEVSCIGQWHVSGQHGVRESVASSVIKGGLDAPA